MLSKKLEIEDIINGKVYQVVPPEVEYCLIEFKLLVISILKSFSDWNKKNKRTTAIKILKKIEFYNPNYKNKFIKNLWIKYPPTSKNIPLV